MDARTQLVQAALDALSVRTLALSVHDASFPGTPDEDTGRGSPYSQGARGYLEFVRALGFNAVLFGPQGQTSRDNASPYDGTVFSRNVLNLALAPLARDPAWAGLLREETLRAITRARPDGADKRVPYQLAWDAQHRALDEVAASYRARAHAAAPGDPIARIAHEARELARAKALWLTRDALWEPLCREHGAGHFKLWTRDDGAPHPDQFLFAPRAGEAPACEARLRELAAREREHIERYTLLQSLLATQHRALREHAARLGLTLLGDLQIGLAPQDVWAFRGLFLERYLMGAPPSRTNPEGQPWNYAVFDPALYHGDSTDGARATEGPVLAYLAARIDRLLTEFDGLRIDHPHGLVCPWVYRADEPDSLRAVQTGARLFDSPALPDHPALARYAIARSEQLSPDPRTPRYAEDWVRELTEAQVARYATLLDAVLRSAARNGRAREALLCEVLSTQPYPLARVMERYGLGRFRVTQKASTSDPRDVYRSENAVPADWIMVGNHDTRPLALVAEEWCATGAARARAEYLAWRLVPGDAPGSGAARAATAARLADDAAELTQAMYADLFASRAGHVMVFFADLFGLREVYNAPGTVDPANWSLRVPADYAGAYRAGLARGFALDLPRALAAGIAARGGAFAEGHRALREALLALPTAPR